MNERQPPTPPAELVGLNAQARYVLDACLYAAARIGREMGGDATGAEIRASQAREVAAYNAERLREAVEEIDRLREEAARDRRALLGLLRRWVKLSEGPDVPDRFGPLITASIDALTVGEECDT